MRAGLGWAVGNTRTPSLCPLALERAKARAGCVLEIFNTGHGSQFTLCLSSQTPREHLKKRRKALAQPLAKNETDYPPLGIP